MAVSHAFWKGHIKLSLVTCPIAIYPASSSSERIAFRQISRTTGHRLRQQLVDEVTRKPVDAGDKGRGYEFGKGNYVEVTDEDFETVTIDSSKALDIDRFVPRSQIDERYLDSPYYIVPDGKIGLDAFSVIREAMREEGMVALARVVLARRERVMMLKPWERGIMGETLRYAYEVRDAEDYFGGIEDVKIGKEMLSLAKHIVAEKTDAFDPTQFRDRYEEALAAMLEAKTAGLPQPAQSTSNEPGNVIDLMAALRKSLGDAPAGKSKTLSKPDTKKSTIGQREMLLPIKGDGKKASSPAKSRGRYKAA